MKILLNNFSIFVAIGFLEHFGVVCKFQYHTDQGGIQIINKYQKQNWTQKYVSYNTWTHRQDCKMQMQIPVVLRQWRI